MYPTNILKPKYEDISSDNYTIVAEYYQILSNILDSSSSDFGNFTLLDTFNAKTDAEGNSYEEIMNNIKDNANFKNSIINYVNDLRNYLIDKKHQIYFIDKDNDEEELNAILDNLVKGDIVVETTTTFFGAAKYNTIYRTYIADDTGITSFTHNYNVNYGYTITESDIKIANEVTYHIVIKLTNNTYTTTDSNLSSARYLELNIEDIKDGDEIVLFNTGLSGISINYILLNGTPVSFYKNSSMGTSVTIKNKNYICLKYQSKLGYFDNTHVSGIKMNDIIVQDGFYVYDNDKLYKDKYDFEYCYDVLFGNSSWSDDKINYSLLTSTFSDIINNSNLKLIKLSNNLYNIRGIIELNLTNMSTSNLSSFTNSLINFNYSGSLKIGTIVKTQATIPLTYNECPSLEVHKLIPCNTSKSDQNGFATLTIDTNGVLYLSACSMKSFSATDTCQFLVDIIYSTV